MTEKRERKRERDRQRERQNSCHHFDDRLGLSAPDRGHCAKHSHATHPSEHFAAKQGPVFNDED